MLWTLVSRLSLHLRTFWHDRKKLVTFIIIHLTCSLYLLNRQGDTTIVINCNQNWYFVFTKRFRSLFQHFIKSSLAPCSFQSSWVSSFKISTIHPERSSQACPSLITYTRRDSIRQGLSSTWCLLDMEFGFNFLSHQKNISPSVLRDL